MITGSPSLRELDVGDNYIGGAMYRMLSCFDEYGSSLSGEIVGIITCI